MTESLSARDEREPSSGRRFEGPMGLLVSIGANVTVLGALLMFFGWKRAEAHNRILGLSESIYGMSPQDYMLRSVDALFALLAIIAVLVLAWLRLHTILSRMLDQRRHLGLLTGVIRVLGWSWFLLPAACWLFRLGFKQQGYVVVPLSLGAGALLTWHGMHLRGQLDTARTGTPPATQPAWHSALSKTFLAIIVTLSVFWGVSNYAEVVGVRLARALPAILPDSPQVVVYSPERLGIDAPGAEEEPIRQPDSAYRFRYTGLRLLDHTGGKYFLVSDGWTPEYGVVVVLAESDPVRLEFVHDYRTAPIQGDR